METRALRVDQCSADTDLGPRPSSALAERGLESPLHEGLVTNTHLGSPTPSFQMRKLRPRKVSNGDQA